LVTSFIDIAKQTGNEVAEIINAFETDSKMHLYLYGKKLPEGKNGLEGQTIPAIKVGENWKYSFNLTDDDWNTLPGSAEPRIELHIYYTGAGLDKDHSKHFYTLLHEFAVHAKPFYDVFKKIRSGHGPKSIDAAAAVGRHEHHEQQHNDMALGKNIFYERLYSQAIEIIKAMKGKAKNISVEGIVDQGDIDKYTQKLKLLIQMNATSNKKIEEAIKVYNTTPNKENYAKLHQILQVQTDAFKPIKEDFALFTSMFELWPQLVAGAPELHASGSKAVYDLLIPKIKNLEQQSAIYYDYLAKKLTEATAELNEMK
jgi:hypothetical protein